MGGDGGGARGVEDGGKLPDHLPALDGLRGLAALLVISHHFLFKVGGSSRLEHLFHRFVIVGTWSGVDLFFVLSGFLITRILLRTKSSPNYFATFYGRRVLRIFPLYYMVLTAFLVVLPAVSAEWREVLPALVPSPIGLWTYTSNLHLVPSSLRILGHMWSLMVEEHFYMVWPFLVWIATPRGLMRICVGAIAASAVIRFAVLDHGLSPEVAYTFTPARVDGLACGALVALLLDGRGVDRRAMRLAAFASIGAGLLLIPVAIHDTALFLYGAWVQRVGYPLLAIFFAGVLVRVVGAPAGSRASRFFSSRVMTFFGKYSYGAYVYHLPIMELVFEPLHVRERIDAVVGHDLGALVYFAFAVVESYGLAFASYELIESRFLRMKRYFQYGKPTHEVIPCRETSTTSP